MIQFFRQIRQNELSKHKFTKYFLYALGEILLVVIGILIALQVNNWNEKRQNFNKEQTYLKQLLEDLNLQLSEVQLQQQIEEIDSISIKHIVSAINGYFQDTDIVQFNKDLTNIGNTRTFNVFSSTYDELISTGGITLISDVKLKQTINAFYQKIKRYQSVLNKNSFEVNRFRLEDLYRNGFMLIEHDSTNIGIEGENSNNLDIKKDIKDSLRTLALKNIKEEHNLLLLTNATSSRWAIYHVAMDILREMEKDIEQIIGEIKSQISN